jgi:hypothetical protein
VTFEAKLAFIAFFLLCWSLLGLIPWAAASVWVRGRGALLALPLALGGACAAGIAVPLLGQRDAAGFFLSLLTALAGGLAGSLCGIALARRIGTAAAQPRSALDHPIGSPRPPVTAEAPDPARHTDT